MSEWVNDYTVPVPAWISEVGLTLEEIGMITFLQCWINNGNSDKFTEQASTPEFGKLFDKFSKMGVVKYVINSNKIALEIDFSPLKDGPTS